MKLQAEIDGQVHDVDIKRDGEHVYASVDGREYELVVNELEPGAVLINHNSQIYEVFASQPEKIGQPVRVNIRNSEFAIAIIDPKRLRGSVANHLHEGGLVEIRTAMPGKVVRILSTVGRGVHKGDGVIIVEAMKMQNEMKSPKDGTIKEIRVTEGSTVDAGEVLVVIE